MIVNGGEVFPVTDDPELLAALRHQDSEGMGSRELGQFAAEHLGLQPPRLDGANQVPDIVEIWLPGADEGILVWGLHDVPEADPEDDFDPTGAGWESTGWTADGWTPPPWMRLTYTAGDENVVKLCHSHHETIEAFRQFKRDTQRHGRLRVEVESDGALHVDISAEGDFLAMQYVNRARTWLAVSPPPVRDDDTLRHLVAWYTALETREPVPESARIPWSAVEGVLEELIEAPETPPGSVSWVRAS
ncbi:hypothetical protein [Glycomyces sp. YM15]|uniref:hypothetical protein n=1 Tax=Glycomyces sp. YM15 TaxID=2800446 RepID=UPI00196559E2|nr:hypothetical protein [Glycomyces sp. YM15]